MNKEEIEVKTIKTIADIFGKQPSEITRETSFTDDLQSSSMTMLALIAALSGEFGIKISQSEVQENKTVGQAIDWIAQKLEESN
jgi:acyl carrier protein